MYVKGKKRGCKGKKEVEIISVFNPKNALKLISKK